MSEILVRKAELRDVPTVYELIQPYVDENIVLQKDLVVLYESMRDFAVVEVDGRVVGCGALHVLWRDLGELRTIAVEPGMRGYGIGYRLVEFLVAEAREIGLSRLFCLTFETDFFARHGFEPVAERVIDTGTYREMLRSPDEGTAEFLDLPWVKPNTLGNTRMILSL
ncbi:MULTISPECIES: amino-acid N-acetyltransferase [Gulosibacter]|uniref:amino-acid N-acetyltransferase n=1 Tax=Gulosibacter TaxID=256818 RepID=UPI00191AE07E|nr:amino-acid N-acetyltransferase [Gulosibacter hominis]